MSQHPRNPNAFMGGILFLLFCSGLIVTIIGAFYDYWRFPGLILLCGSVVGLLLLIGTRNPRPV